MLEEAAKHIREGILLGRTDIVKKLLEEVKQCIEDKREGESLSTYQVFLDEHHSTVGSFLHEAVKHGKKDIVRALLQEGADPCILNTDQKTCVDISSSKDMQQVFASVLLQAIATDNTLQVNQLIRAGLDVNVTWDSESTKNNSLHWAVSFGTPDMVKLLVENWSADVNARNANGESALHEAVNRGDLSIVEILLKNGADTKIRPTQGKFSNMTAFDISHGTKDDISEKLRALWIKYEQSFFVEQSNSHSSENGIAYIDENKMENDLKIVDSSADTENQPQLKLKPKQASPLPPVITDERLNLLWPQPTFMNQLASPEEELNIFPQKLTLAISAGKFSIHKILDVWNNQRPNLATIKRQVVLYQENPNLAFDIKAMSQPSIVCTLNESLFSNVTGAYRLTIANHQIRIAAPSLCGLHNAIMTMIQLFTLFCPGSVQVHEEIMALKIAEPSRFDKGDNPETTPKGRFKEGIVSVHIDDEPGSRIRAVLLDVNPFGRVPKMETLFSMIDVWARMKINQFHIFVRVGKETKTPEILAYSKGDMLSVDRYCQDRFIDCIPALDVDQSVTSFEELLQIREKLMNIVSCFDHPKFIHLGPKLTSLLIDSPKKMNNLHQLINVDSDCVFILCANSIQNSGLRLQTIPPNYMLLHYGFQSRFDREPLVCKPTLGHDQFTPTLHRFASAGLPVSICTGTAAWSNLSGWPEATISNNCSAIKSIDKTRGLGVVVANWSSHPAFAHSVFAWPGFFVAAGLAWNHSVSESFISSTLGDLLDLYVLGDLSILERLPPLDETHTEIFSPGRALLELGRAENFLDEKRRKNQSEFDFRVSANASAETTLLKLLVSPDDVTFDGLNIEDFAVVIQHIRRVQSHLLKCESPMDGRAEYSRQELQLTSELLLLAARIGRALRTAGSQPESRSPSKQTEASSHAQSGSLSAINIGIANLQPTFRTDIANKLLCLVEQYRALWLTCYQAQGLPGSLFALSALLGKFIPEDST